MKLYDTVLIIILIFDYYLNISLLKSCPTNLLIRNREMGPCQMSKIMKRLMNQKQKLSIGRVFLLILVSFKS